MQFRATFIFAIATFTVLTAAAPVSQIDNVETIASSETTTVENSAPVVSERGCIWWCF